MKKSKFKMIAIHVINSFTWNYFHCFPVPPKVKFENNRDALICMNSITGCIFSGIHFKTLQPLAGYFPLINANTIPNRMLENLLRIICIICFGASLGVFADIRVIDDGERAGKWIFIICCRY